MNPLLWHYTTFDVFRKILKQGAILPDKTEPDNIKEISTVIFSKHPDWEPTRYRLGKLPNGDIIFLNKLLQKQFCGGIIRIGVEPSVVPLDWHTMKDITNITQTSKKSVYDFALSVGARTSHWFGTTIPVPVSQWSKIQIFNDDWTDLEIMPNVDDVDLSIPVGGVVEIKFLDEVVDLEAPKEELIDNTEQSEYIKTGE